MTANNNNPPNNGVPIVPEGYRDIPEEDRKKAKRASRKKRKAEKPLKERDYPRGSKKPKVKKMARGQAKR